MATSVKAPYNAFRDALRHSRNIIAVAGAGLSAASGIPTFRDPGGYWKKYKPETLATPEAFAEDPSLVWQFYHYRRSIVLKAEPNPAHTALALLSCPDVLKAIAPQANFTLITQNVDGLSPRALADVLKKKNMDTSVASPIYEMHGRLADTICTNCGRRENNTTDESLCPALAAAGVPLADGAPVVDDDAVAHIPVEDLPHCRECGGLLRPGVVWFGEQPLYMRDIWKKVDEADMCLVVGTSSVVYPSAAFAEEVSANGGKVAVFNIQNTLGDDEADFVFLGPCEDTLPIALFASEEQLTPKLPSQKGIWPMGPLLE